MPSRERGCRRTIAQQYRQAGVLRIWTGARKNWRRKVQSGVEPNDRQYSRKLERKLKRLLPEEFDTLLNGSEEEDEQQTLPACKLERENRWDGR
jgi:hypothetical protein